MIQLQVCFVWLWLRSFSPVELRLQRVSVFGHAAFCSHEMGERKKRGSEAKRNQTCPPCFSHKGHEHTAKKRKRTQYYPVLDHFKD